MKSEHQKKFAGFFKMCWEAQGKADVVLIHHPGVIGDNYEEIVENLNYLAHAKLSLMIIPPNER